MKTSAPRQPSAPITTARSHFPPEDIEVFKREAEKILQGRVSMGPWVEKFEKAAAEAHGTTYAIATNSCTSALEIALLAAGVQPGDKVIVPVETFIATGMAVHNVGATPVFVDIRRETLCMDPDELQRQDTQGVRAVILVHFGGLITPDLERIEHICADRGWTLIEDAAHAHAARNKGRLAGSIGKAACFSYYPTKLITTGEGGMLTTNDERLYQIAKSYQSRGQDLAAPGEQFALPYGRNIRVPEMSALLGVLQYKRLDEFVAKRRRVAEIYGQGLADETEIWIPPVPIECFHNYWLYTVIMPEGTNRDAMKKRLKDEWQIDIGWSYFPPLHLMPVFRRLYSTEAGMCPVAEDLLSRNICMPIHPLISDEDAQRTVECFLHVYREVGSPATNR